MGDKAMNVGKRGLVVEDEELVRSVICETLMEEGFHVTAASDGDDALDLLNHAPAFDLLLTDVHMPGRTDGFGVAAHARAQDPDLPIVVVTGRPEAGRGVAGLCPHCAFVTKPYTLSAILGAISTARD